MKTGGAKTEFSKKDPEIMKMRLIHFLGVGLELVLDAIRRNIKYSLSIRLFGKCTVSLYFTNFSSLSPKHSSRRSVSIPRRSQTRTKHADLVTLET